MNAQKSPVAAVHNILLYICQCLLLLPTSKILHAFSALNDFRCQSGKYIPENLRCNGQYDCPRGDYSDEKNCRKSFAFLGI